MPRSFLPEDKCPRRSNEDYFGSFVPEWSSDETLFRIDRGGLLRWLHATRMAADSLSRWDRRGKRKMAVDVLFFRESPCNCTVTEYRLKVKEPRWLFGENYGLNWIVPPDSRRRNKSDIMSLDFVGSLLLVDILEAASRERLEDQDDAPEYRFKLAYEGDSITKLTCLGAWASWD